MSDFQNAYIKDKSLEELIDALGLPTALPGSVVHETLKAAMQAKLVERLARPQKWAGFSLGAAVVSALAAVASVIAGA